MSNTVEIRPNLFIIGAAKAGTTSLHHYLQSHPDVFMSRPKEPGYFSPGAAEYPTDTGWYLDLFQAAGDAKFVGESSTHYTMLPTYPEVASRIAGFCDDPRFIYLIRDPIDRAISHYWQRARQFAEHRSLETALRRDEIYVAYGDYRMQLQPYFDTFGRDRVLVLVFEDMVRDPARTLRRVYDWLGLDAAQAPRVFETRNRRPEEVKRTRGFGLLDRLARTGLWNRLSPFVPVSLKAVGNRLAVEEVAPADEPVDAVVEMYRPIFQPRVGELEEELHLDLSVWKTTLGAKALSLPSASDG